jgi:molecular chaperone GrpE
MSEKSRGSHRSTEEPAAERIVIRDKRKIDTGKSGGRHAKQAEDAPAPAAEGKVEQSTAEPASVEAPSESAAAGGLGAELEALRADLEERTRDLQRVTAEYANYRKRVDRDRGVAAEQTTGAVLSALLPILDDLDRAREHGDLVGPFGSVAEHLTAALTKFGLTGFGEKGDPFDPTRHEAVAHLTSAEVTEPTCVEIMRRGYLLGERLLRPALVAVADPE